MDSQTIRRSLHTATRAGSQKNKRCNKGGALWAAVVIGRGMHRGGRRHARARYMAAHSPEKTLSLIVRAWRAIKRAAGIK